MQLYLALIALIVVQQVPQATAGQLQPPSVFPDAASTGVPSGTTLEKSGPLKISDEGTVVDSMEISGPIVVDAPNVTIRNSLIRSGSHYGIEGTPKARGLKVVNNELDGGGLMPGSYGISAPSDATITGNKIRRFENGIMTGSNNVITGNFIADLLTTGDDPHYDGIAVQGGQTNVLIQGNTVVSWDTSAVFIKNDFGPITNVRVLHNLLQCQPGKKYSYAIYVDGRANGGPISDIRVEGNMVEAGRYGQYFSIDEASPTITGNRSLDDKPIF